MTSPTRSNKLATQAVGRPLLALLRTMLAGRTDVSGRPPLSPPARR